MNRGEESNDPLSSSDYGMEDRESHVDSENLSYSQENLITESQRDDESEEGRSSGDYYDEEESDNEQDHDALVGVDGETEVTSGSGRSPAYPHRTGVGNESAQDNDGNERLFSVQALLGNIAQGIQDGSNNDTRSWASPNMLGSRHGLSNLAETFPEIISLLSDGMRGNGNGERSNRLSILVNNVAEASEDPYVAMESLRELSQHLLMVDQMIVDRTLPVEKLLKAIISILSNRSLNEELELQLMSCRCLFNLFEANPESISMAVDQGVIPNLEGKLQEISYIDLAEQVLETLELISRLHGKEILRSGGLTSCLQYLDFFTIHAQRKAVAIVCNSCCRVRAEDLEMIQELLKMLKPILVSATDPFISDKLLTAFYGICEGLQNKTILESLISIDVLQRLGHLVSISETSLDSKLRCFDIISVAVNFSEKLSKEFVENCDIINILLSCFSGYSKKKNGALHETLIYVPKPLLHAIARTIALIFPTEYEQVLSVDKPKKNNFASNDKVFEKLLRDLTPLLIEIYVNTVDFEVRRLVLIALARVATCVEVSEVEGIDGSIVRLAGSSLAQSDHLLEKGKEQLLVSSTLIVGVLSLLDILTARFSASVLATLSREGIFNLIKNLQITLQKGQEEGKIAIPVHDFSVNKLATSETDNNLDNEEDYAEDEEYDTQFSLVDIPNDVKPKTIGFEVLRPPSLEYAYWKMSQLSKKLLITFEIDENTVIEELSDIEELVKHLYQIDIQQSSAEVWREVWSRVKNSMFKENFEISSFELISTGLAAALSDTICKIGSKTSIAKQTFHEVFEIKARYFIDILQSALTRLETFQIIECGLQGDEGRFASLGKQVKIKLVYDGDSTDNAFGQNLSSATLSIHCIASFKTLNEFLKHRIAQTKFLNSMLPGMTSSESTTTEDDDIEQVRDWMFEFSTEEETLKLSDTIFYAIFRAFKSSGKDLDALWHEPQVINFRRIERGSVSQDRTLQTIYTHEIDTGRKILKPADDIFTILRFIRTKGIPDELFINSKLSAKLSRQLDEPLVVASGILPDWTLQLTKEYSFLFPFDTRLFFLQCTSFGYGRLIQLWRNRMGAMKESNGEDSLQKLGRITRHKLRISRKTLFLSALKVLDKYGASPSVLEIEYQGEVGTGLGPTLEFYACASREFTKKNLNMWRCDQYNDSDSDYVTNPLFPVPLELSGDSKKVFELFRYLGIFVARSMLDNRILDFNFNRTLFDLTHQRCRDGGKSKLDCHKPIEEKLLILASIDEHLAKSLKYLHEHRTSSSDLEQLTLPFTLPGSDIDLIENGSEVMLTSTNVDSYIELVIDFFIGSGIEKQLDHFIEGFSEVFPYASLLLLNPDELINMFGSFEEDWTPATLYTSINADHGYSMDSSTIHELVSIMASFTRQERRLFLQFITGSPKLPIGGFKSLKPRLTVVLKHPDDGSSPDAYLPSVMTCANYFKLPKYTDRMTMKSRIVQAMNEGTGAFLLS